MKKLYIVIPAYNEAENIKEVIEGWYIVLEEHELSEESRLLIIDDGSKDDTYQIMCEMQEGRPLFTPLTKKNSGHGATLIYGYQYALEHGADYIFQTDSDGQTLPDEFYVFWKLREKYDMVIGHRNQRQDGFSRVFVTKVLKLVIRICFGVTVTDANTPFRLMSAAMLKEQMKYIPENYNLPNVLISVICEKRKLKVKYLPITFRPRQGGVNSINLKKISKIGIQAIKDFTYINQVLGRVKGEGKKK